MKAEESDQNQPSLDSLEKDTLEKKYQVII